jgi:D-alanyl-D-alanine carboxypeptidase
MSRRRSLFFTSCLMLLAAFSAIGCGGGAETPLDARLQRVLDDGVARHGIQGVSAAIVFPDGSLWKGTSGVSHGTVAMAPEMIFAIGSVTKNVGAALALQLVEEGRLGLDDPVSRYLPPFEHVDGDITIRQLLGHTSGLYMFWDNDQLWEALRADRARIWSPEEVLTYIEDPYFEPGEDWRYSNTNYLLLGMILENVTGSKLSAEFRSRFWEPLGIDGYLSSQQEVPEPLAHVFGDDFQFGPKEKDLTYEPRASHETIIFGSGGLFMTAEDLACWGRALFSGQIVGEPALNEMLRFVSFPPMSRMQGYGLGVQEYERRFASGERAIGHGGASIGTATHMVYLPEHDLSLAVMVNAFPTSSAGDIASGLIRVVLRDAGAVRWIPYLSSSPVGVLVCCALVGVALAIALRRRYG